MRKRPGLVGSIICIGICFAFIWTFDKKSYLHCDRDFCYIRSVYNNKNIKDKKLIPVSEIKSIEYEVKKAGEYSDNPEDYLGVIYMTPKHGDCTFEVTRNFSTSRSALDSSMKKLVKEIETSLQSNKSDFDISLNNLLKNNVDF